MIKRYDKDGDGALSQSEVPEKMWSRISAADENHDGKISQQ